MKAKSNSKSFAEKRKGIKVKTTCKAGWFWDQPLIVTLKDLERATRTSQ